MQNDPRKIVTEQQWRDAIDAYELGRIGMDDNCIDHNVLTL